MHKFSSYLSKIIRNIVQKRSVTGYSQFLKLWQMPTLHPPSILKIQATTKQVMFWLDSSKVVGSACTSVQKKSSMVPTVALVVGNSKHCLLSVATDFSISWQRPASFFVKQIAEPLSFFTLNLLCILFLLPKSGVCSLHVIEITLALAAASSACNCAFASSSSVTREHC
jgi:hypothetical protein